MNFYQPNSTISPNFSGNDIELGKIVNTLWRGKWIIFTLIILCYGASDIYNRYLSVELYPSTAKIALEEGKPRKVLTNIESVETRSLITDIDINTEIEILRSGELVGKLVDSLDLTNQSALNPYLREPSLLRSFITNLLPFFDILPDTSKTMPSLEKQRSSVFSHVRNSMAFSNTPNTRVINILVTTTNADLSVIIANKMAELYIKSKIQIKLKELKTATDFLSNRASELKHDFENLKIKLASFSSKSKLINPDNLVAQVIKLRDLRMRLSDASKLVITETNKHTKLLSLRESGNLKELINYADNFRLNRTFQRYSNNNLSLEGINLEINRHILNLESEHKRKQKQLLALKRSESLLASQIERQSQELIILEQLELETEAARLLYESFFTRLLETEVQLGLETADARILATATKKGTTNLNKSQIIIIGCTIGFIIGAGIVLMREFRFSGYRSINELRDNSGYRVLASVPFISVKHKKSAISYLKNNPNSLVAEAVRNMRTSILMSQLDIIPQVIMFTSSVPKEGKTMLTFALAQNMVGLGKRILLIEADIRRSTHSVKINRQNTVAFVDLILGNKEFKDVNLFVEELGHDILTASKTDMNAADIFASHQFPKLLTELRNHYDYILIDSPPVLSVPDARLIGANSDVSIYIVKWDKTTRDQVDQGLDMLTSIGINATGLVLNQVDPRRMKTYGYISPYGYNAYGSEYYDS